MAALFRQTPDLFRLSQVFFDNSHTLALGAVNFKLLRRFVWRREVARPSQAQRRLGGPGLDALHDNLVT